MEQHPTSGEIRIVYAKMPYEEIREPSYAKTPYEKIIEVSYPRTSRSQERHRAEHIAQTLARQEAKERVRARARALNTIKFGLVTPHEEGGEHEERERADRPAEKAEGHEGQLERADSAIAFTEETEGTEMEPDFLDDVHYSYHPPPPPNSPSFFKQPSSTTCSSVWTTASDRDNLLPENENSSFKDRYILRSDGQLVPRSPERAHERFLRNVKIVGRGVKGSVKESWMYKGTKRAASKLSRGLGKLTGDGDKPVLTKEGRESVLLDVLADVGILGSAGKGDEETSRDGTCRAWDGRDGRRRLDKGWSPAGEWGTGESFDRVDVGHGQVEMGKVDFAETRCCGRI